MTDGNRERLKQMIKQGLVRNEVDRFGEFHLRKRNSWNCFVEYTSRWCYKTSTHFFGFFLTKSEIGGVDFLPGNKSGARPEVTNKNSIRQRTEIFLRPYRMHVEWAVQIGHSKKIT